MKNKLKNYIFKYILQYILIKLKRILKFEKKQNENIKVYIVNILYFNINKY